MAIINVKISKTSNVLVAVSAHCKGDKATLDFAVSIDGKEIRKGSSVCQSHTPNAAQWEAVLRAIKYMCSGDREHLPCTISTPSNLVINQMEGKAKILSPSIRQYTAIAAELICARSAPIMFVVA